MSSEKNKLTANPSQIANKFNIYFNKLALCLVSKMQLPKKSHKDYLYTCINDSSFINPSTLSEIGLLTDHLDPNKTTGICNFPTI